MLTSLLPTTVHGANKLLLLLLLKEVDSVGLRERVIYTLSVLIGLIRNELYKFVELKFEFFSFNTFDVSDILATSCTTEAQNTVIIITKRGWQCKAGRE